MKIEVLLEEEKQFADFGATKWSIALENPEKATDQEKEWFCRTFQNSGTYQEMLKL